MRPAAVEVRELLLSAWRRTIHLWRPMAVWTAAVWMAVAVVLGPLSSVLLGRRLLGADAIRGNEELLSWLVTPAGLGYALLLVALGVSAGAVRYAGLFHIVTADLEGRSPAVRSIAIRLAREAPELVRLCIGVAAAALLSLGVLAAGPVGVRVALLSEFDVNYYLTARPREWWIAVALAGAWTLVWVSAFAYLLGRTLLALPAYLDGHRPGRAALRLAWRRTRGRVASLLGAILASVGTWVLARVVLDAAYLRAATSVIQEVGGAFPSIHPLVLATAGLAAGSVALDAVVGFLGFSFVATALTKCYREDTDLHAAAPPVPSLDDLGSRALETARPWLRPSRLLPASVAALLVSLALSGWLLERMPELGPAVVTAHRGGPAPAPENTLAALERSIEAGADFAEIDVQRTRDDSVVVIHDADLMRMGGVPLRVRRAEYADLATVVLGSGDPGSPVPESPFPVADRRVATLTQFLERARGRIGLMVELKYYGEDPRLAARTVEAVRSAGMEDEVILMSLDLAAVRQVRRIAPDVRVAYASAVTAGDLSRLPVDVLAVSRSRATRSLIRAAHRRGLEVHVWTLNETHRMVSAVERGADGIITDRPTLAVRVNRELSELPAALRLLLRFRRIAVAEEDEEAAPPEL